MQPCKTGQGIQVNVPGAVNLYTPYGLGFDTTADVNVIILHVDANIPIKALGCAALRCEQLCKVKE